MKASKDQTELRRFLGMINRLSKFQPQTAELTKPLRDLLSSKNQWLWSNDQDDAFRAIKESLTSTPTLAHYDASRDTKLSSDASTYGLRDRGVGGQGGGARAPPNIFKIVKS